MSDVAIHNGAAALQESGLVAALGQRSVVLVGMMGAGKSSIGRRLAGRLEIPFVDADTEIEKAAGMSIPEIFSAHGEPYFRAGETRVIARLLDGGPQVLATGGGAFMNPETRTTIRAKGISVWLRASVEVLARRIKRRNDRPLLKGADPIETLRRLVDERYPTYAEADITVNRATHRMMQSSKKSLPVYAARRGLPRRRKRKKAEARNDGAVRCSGAQSR